MRSPSTWWPGNVRQLRNEIQRAVAMSGPGDLVKPEHLSPELNGLQITSVSDLAPARGRPAHTGDLASAIAQVEGDVIRTTLSRHGGNVSRSARTLGLTRRGLYLKMRRLGIQPRATID